jgi:polyisoprenoid-binding protein YceI
MSWKIDPAHTRIEFSARHMMITTVRGEFQKFSGTVDFDEKNPTNSKIKIEIDAASLNTHTADRDTHLRSADFLDVQNFPTITFTSKSVTVKDGNHARLVGDLTIHGVTKDVALDVEYSGLLKSPWGTTVAGFNATTKINRKDWGLVWNVAIEAGGVLVSEEISINIEAELIQEVPAAASAGAASA